MQTTAFNRPSINSTQSITADDADKTDAASRDGTVKGYGRLPEGITLEDALKQHYFDPQLAELIDSVLVHNKFPSIDQDAQSLASTMVRAGQPVLLCKVLAIAPAMTNVHCEEFAKSLLVIMQSGFSFSGLTLQLRTGSPEAALNKIVPLLEQAFLANSSLTAIQIFSQGEDFNGLTSLFDVLAEVKLRALHIDKSPGGSGFDLIMQGLMLNRGIEAVTLCDPASSRLSPICGTLAEMLKVNGTIEIVSIELFPSDPELDDFEQLALIDPRLQITLNSQQESSDSEEASSGSEDPSVH